MIRWRGLFCRPVMGTDSNGKPTYMYGYAYEHYYGIENGEKKAQYINLNQ